MELFRIDKIMNKSYHCSRVGNKRRCKADRGDDLIIKRFNLENSFCRGKYIPKSEVKLDDLMNAYEASKDFVFKKEAVYNYIQI